MDERLRALEREAGEDPAAASRLVRARAQAGVLDRAPEVLPTGVWPADVRPDLVHESLRAAWSRTTGVGSYVHEREDGTVLVWIPPGRFRMGSTSGPDDEQPVHEVRFAQGFFLAKYETTWGQLRAFCRATGRPAPSPPAFEVDDRHPVVNVTWDEAVAYGQWAGLRLPSEAEWEYACRAGSTRDYTFGDDAARLAAHAWYATTADDGTHPVGEKRANPWGLHDVHGNVWEWVQDPYLDHYVGAPEDGSAREAGAALRVGRGGGWQDRARTCRAAHRGFVGPWIRFDDLGFRAAR